MEDRTPDKKRIMVIDDEGDLLRMARIRLESGGYEVVTLDSGNRVVEAVKEQKPDLVLLDIVMSGKSGYEVCLELKADKETGKIPLIVFTAHYHREEDFKKSAGDCGADGYMLKPFEAQELLAKIESLTIH